MKLNLRPAEECTFDAVSLGEVMLRLDPGEGRIRTARAEVKFKESISNSQGHFITHLPSDASNRYMVLSDKDYEAFTYEDIPSNVVNPVKSNVICKRINSASVCSSCRNNS